jgi:hypothetical protein
MVAAITVDASVAGETVTKLIALIQLAVLSVGRGSSSGILGLPVLVRSMPARHVDICRLVH